MSKDFKWTNEKWKSVSKEIRAKIDSMPDSKEKDCLLHTYKFLNLFHMYADFQGKEFDWANEMAKYRNRVFDSFENIIKD